VCVCVCVRACVCVYVLCVRERECLLSCAVLFKNAHWQHGAFQSGLDQFQDAFDTFMAFRAHIYDCFATFYAQHCDIIAAYTALIQSSGTGKTLLCFKFLKEDFGYYVCLRPQDSTGYPKRTPAIADYLLDAENAAIASERLLLFHEALARAFNDWYSTAPSQTPEAWNKHTGLEAHDSKSFCTFAESLVESANSLKDSEVDFRRFESRCGHKRPFYVVFDEASHFISGSAKVVDDLFSCRRRVWHPKFLGRANLFAILLDTHSRISGFLPTAANAKDSSSRAREGFKLFKPFYALGWFDLPLLCPPSPQTTESGVPKVYHELISILALGRPLWGSHLRPLLPQFRSALPSVRYMLSDHVKFARDKLFGGSTCKIGDLAHIPLLACRVVLRVSLTFSHTESLVAEHMAFCLHISDERDRLPGLAVNYASEPVLAEASALHMRSWCGKRTAISDPVMTITDENYAKAINDLTKSIAVGEVNVGYIGELVAQLLFVLTRDLIAIEMGSTPGTSPRESCDAWLHEYVNTEVDLNYFLRRFCNVAACPHRKDEDLEAIYPPDAATLRLSHFVPISYTPTRREELKDAYDRGAGLVCKAGQRGVDMIVPIKYQQADSPHLSHYSCLVIQVKNVQEFGNSMVEVALSSLKMASSMPKLSLLPDVADNAVHLLISLGEADTSSSCVRQASGQSLHVRRSGRLRTADSRASEATAQCPFHPLGYNILGFTANTFPMLFDRLPKTAHALSTLLLRCGDPTQHGDVADARRLMAFQPLVYSDEQRTQVETRCRETIRKSAADNKAKVEALGAQAQSWVPEGQAVAHALSGLNLEPENQESPS
jgi:hypothetical protein